MMPIADALGAFCGAIPLEPGLLVGLFLAGLAGGPLHCGPMCGGFVLGQVADRMADLPERQLCEWRRIGSAALLPYHAGRITTYAALGGLAGFGGSLAGRLPLASAALLMLAAGLFGLMAWRRFAPSGRLPNWIAGLGRPAAGGGFGASRWFARWRGGAAPAAAFGGHGPRGDGAAAAREDARGVGMAAARRVNPIPGPLPAYQGAQGQASGIRLPIIQRSGIQRSGIQRPGIQGAGIRRSGIRLGLLLGFLPCGFLYAALAAAASSQDGLTGALGMAAFGAGTVPALLVVGLVGHAAGRRWQAAIASVAPFLLVVNAALLTLLAIRGLLA